MDGQFISRQFKINQKHSLEEIQKTLAHWGLEIDGTIHINGFDCEALYEQETRNLTLNFQKKPKPGEYVFLKIDDVINSVTRRIIGSLV